MHVFDLSQLVLARVGDTVLQEKLKLKVSIFAVNLPACCGRTMVSFKPLKEIFLAATGLGGTGCMR